MCGIVGAVAERNVVGILLEGLRRLEYRGYDSAGVALLSDSGDMTLVRAQGKVAELELALSHSKLPEDSSGTCGIAHTRWATHGKPSEKNAHPHCSEQIAVVHNGIIENHEALKSELVAAGYVFKSETDTEVVAHLLHQQFLSASDPMSAFASVLDRLQGAYALCVADRTNPDHLYFARQGSPLVLGVGLGENYVASDQMALRPVTDRFMFLHEGDYGRVSKAGFNVFSRDGQPVTRELNQVKEDAFDAEKGPFKHFMLKEIYEQPEVMQRTFESHLRSDGLILESFGAGLPDILAKTRSVAIVACGTSYHAGLVARYWIEAYLGIPVTVEVASEYRYRRVTVPPDTLFVTITQSGETADTLSALLKAKTLGYLSTLTICNVSSSSMVREADHSLLTRAGPEIGVASTKAFTTQLVSLLLMVGAIAKAQSGEQSVQSGVVEDIESSLRLLPTLSRQLLLLETELAALSEQFADKSHALFLGRGVQYPVAQEGALKLKEVSYIHAEAYPAGELKHGPLALVDKKMPVVAVAPNNDVLEKIRSNLEEVKARGGVLYVFADKDAGFVSDELTQVVNLPHVPELLQPILYSIPLQLLAYHVAIVKGTDIDQPRNLAKSVTVE